MENRINSYFELLKSNDTKSPYVSSGKIGNTKGWKIHLFLNSDVDKYPELDNPVIRKLSKKLFDEDRYHKFANGADGSRSFAIYVGDRNEALKLAQDIDKLFGEEFRKISPKGCDVDEDTTDYMISPNIGIRFDGFKDHFKNYGFRGCPNYHASFYSSEQQKELNLVATHVSLARHYGCKYLGENYKNNASDWDRFLFDGTISKFSAEDINKQADILYDKMEKDKTLVPSLKTHNGININLASKMNNQNQTLLLQKAVEGIYDKW